MSFRTMYKCCKLQNTVRVFFRRNLYRMRARCSQRRAAHATAVTPNAVIHMMSRDW